MRTFEIETPDGRVIRHKAETPQEASKGLLPGYKLAGEVIGAREGIVNSGYSVPIGAGENPLATLLSAHGDSMEAWLRERGYVKAKDL